MTKRLWSSVMAITSLVILTSFAARAQNPSPERSTQVVGHFMKPGYLEASEAAEKQLKVPKGFELSVFAKDMGHSRSMVQAQDGLIYVSDPDAGEIYTVTDQDGHASGKKTIVSGIDKVNGMILHEGKLFFVATENIYSLDPGDKNAKPKIIVAHLPSAGQHWRRQIHEGPDGLMYVSIASTCNDCADGNPENATMQKMKFDGTDKQQVAKGLRDTMGFDWEPGSHELFGMDHGVDWRGDDLPPEELNSIKVGSNYGWPFCWGEKKPDPNLIDDPKGQSKDEYCKTTEAPKLTFPAHSAPIDFKFYTGDKFPSDYKGSAFVTMHGSWNRKKPSGYKVVRIEFKNGQPVKSDDFMTGFLTSKGVFGRPAGMLMKSDGSMLVSDDQNGIIYRVTAKR